MWVPDRMRAVLPKTSEYQTKVNWLFAHGKRSDSSSPIFIHHMPNFIDCWLPQEVDNWYLFAPHDILIPQIDEKNVLRHQKEAAAGRKMKSSSITDYPRNRFLTHSSSLIWQGKPWHWHTEWGLLITISTWQVHKVPPWWQSNMTGLVFWGVRVR